MTRDRNHVAALVALSCGVLAAAPAPAASLTGPVTGWNSGVPSYISMYEYVPATVVAAPPIVVAAHYCGGSASAFFNMASGIVAAADKYGFIMIFPQTTNPATSAKCWDVGSKASLTHDGGGDTQAIAQMVKYEVTSRKADAGRVYIMGASSGGMLTEAMLAVYPDVFKAGAEFSGVPAGCWSAGWSAASNWGGTCANGQDIKTAQAWGDLVRGMYTGYSGSRPRVQLWHGTADPTINYQNQLEGIKEWTNVLGLSTAPTATDTTSVSGFKIEKWQNSCGFTLLEAHTQNGGGHTTPIDANSVISFFGLDKAGADPQTTCSGAGGTSGTGGSAATGGQTAGGTSATGGKATGGSSNVGGGKATGGTATTSGGSSNTGGTKATGGSSNAGGTAAGGVASAIGGATSPTGGSTAAGGANTTVGGGAPTFGGSNATGGTAVGVGGAPTTTSVGDAGASGSSLPDTGDAGGCSCRVAGTRGNSNTLLGFGLLGLAVAVLGRRRAASRAD